MLRYHFLGYFTLRIANCLSGKHGGSEAAVVVPHKLEIYAGMFCTGCVFAKARVMKLLSFCQRSPTVFKRP